MASWDLAGNAGTNPDPPSSNYLGTTDAQPLVIKTDGTERLRIDALGNLGVGVPAPLDILHAFRSSGAVKARFEANNGTGGFRAYSFGTNTSDFDLHVRDETGDYDLLTVTWWNGNIIVGGPQGSGTVGIGVGEPADKLHVFASSGAANLRVEANNEHGGFRAYSFGTNTSDFDLHIRDETGNRDVLTVDWSSGHIGIGTAPGKDMLTIGGLIQVEGVRFPDGSVQQTAQAGSGPGGGVTAALVHVSNVPLSGSWDGQHWDPQQARCSNNFDSQSTIIAGGITWQVEGAVDPKSVIFNVAYDEQGVGTSDRTAFTGLRNGVQTSAAIDPHGPNIYIASVHGASQPFMLRLISR
jgi:hypothetical protein